MKKKWIIIIGSSLMLVVVVAIMGSGGFLKNPLTSNDDVLAYLNNVEDFAKSNDWENAGHEFKKSFSAWEKVKNRIQFSVERDFLEQIDIQLATVKGAIEAKEENEVIITVEKIKVLWKELGR